MSIQLSEMKKLHDKGLALIYLKPKEKRPVESGWTTQSKKSWDELENSFEKNYNLGVRLGTPSQLITGKYLGAIDCDVKSKSRKAITEMNDALRKLGIDLTTAPVVISGRGNGSKHIYVQTTEPMRAMKFAQSEYKVKVLMPGEGNKPHSKTECLKLTPEERDAGYRIRSAWEISFMGTGQQVVLPGSIHPDTGMKYAWGSPLSIKQVPLFNPKPFVKASMSQISPENRDSEKAFKAENVNLYASRLSIPFIQMIEEGKGCEDRSASLMSIMMAMCRAEFTDNQILSVLSDTKNWMAQAAYEHTQSKDRGRAVEWLRKYTLTKARYETDIMRRFENKPAMKKLSSEKKEEIKEELKKEKDWRAELQRTQHKGYKTSLKNTELILSNVMGPQVFLHDLFSSRDSYDMETAWGGKKGDALSDIDLIKIRHWLSGTSFKIEPSKTTTLEAVQFIANRNKVHPVREWLKSLEWDGVSRINTWIRDYLHGDAAEPYLSEVSRIFLLAMVKRVFEPGCQSDYTLVLEGNQGTFKSTTARILAGDKWFMDNLPDLRDKDAMLNLQGKWVIELGELADVKRGDYNAVKAYLNRRIDTVRSPYGMLKQDIPRQNVFIGTVNEGEYLKDPTGNRRFWPVRVGVCDVDQLSRNREQLFAEAMWVYENCFNGKLSLGKKADAQATEAQADRRIEDDSSQMEEMLRDFIVKNKLEPKKKRFNFEAFKMRELFGIFNGPWQEWEGKSYHFQTGAQVLSRMGFIKKKVKGQRIWGAGGSEFGGQGADLHILN